MAEKGSWTADSGSKPGQSAADCDDDGASRRPPETEMQPSPLGPSIGTPTHTTLPRATPACVGDNEAGRPSGETMRATMRATKMLVSSHQVGTQQPQQPRKVAHGQQLQPVHAHKPSGSSQAKIYFGASMHVCSGWAKQGGAHANSDRSAADCRVRGIRGAGQVRRSARK